MMKVANNNKIVNCNSSKTWSKTSDSKSNKNGKPSASNDQMPLATSQKMPQLVWENRWSDLKVKPPWRSPKKTIGDREGWFIINTGSKWLMMVHQFANDSYKSSLIYEHLVFHGKYLLIIIIVKWHLMTDNGCIMMLIYRGPIENQESWCSWLWPNGCIRDPEDIWSTLQTTKISHK